MRSNLRRAAFAFMSVVISFGSFAAGTTPPPVAGISVSPQNATVPNGSKTPCMAVARDGNDHPITPPPVFTWSVSDGGSIDVNGVFTATKAGGPYTITAAVGTTIGTTKITVTDSQPPPAPVLTSLGITPRDTTVALNATATFQAVGLDQNGRPVTPQPAITWSVNDGGTIDSKGVFTGTKVGGPYTVTAASGTLSATAHVTVGTAPPPPVTPVLTSIGITPHDVTVGLNIPTPFFAIGLDQNGKPIQPPPAITFSVSDGGTIDVHGVFIGTKAGGPYTVTAASGTVTGTAKVTVSSTAPPVPPANQVLTHIYITPGESEVHLNDKLMFRGIGIDQNGLPMIQQPPLTWSVNDGGTIDASGLFIATKVGGPYTVTAASGTVTGTASVKVEDSEGPPPTTPPPPAVNPVLTSVYVFPHDARIPLNSQAPFVAVGLDQNHAPMAVQPAFTWTVSDGGTVDANGIFTATKVGGPFTVTATTGTLSGTAQISVVTVPTPAPAPNPVLTSIAVLPHDVEIPVNVKIAFVAVALDQNGAPLATQPAITWTSTPAGGVDATGIFKSPTPGEYTVTATSGAVSGTAKVEVFSLRTPPSSDQTLTSIVVLPKDAKVALGGKVGFKGIGLDQNGMPMKQQPALVWSVNDGGTIDANGVFTGTKTGGAYTVKATSGTLSGTASVTVLGALAIVSGPIALPDPVFVGDNVHLCVYVLGTGSLSAVWDFGDKSAGGNGPVVSHVYATVGTYTATVTVTDGGGNTVSGSVDVTIIPTGTTPTPGTHALTNLLMAAKLAFDKPNSDALVIAGHLSDFDSATVLAGLSVKLDVGGVVKAFALDANGSASTTAGTFNFDPAKKVFQMKLKDGSFAGSWAAEGVDPNASVKLADMVFPVKLTLNGVDYTGSALVLYSSKALKGALIKPNSDKSRRRN